MSPLALYARRLLFFVFYAAILVPRCAGCAFCERLSQEHLHIQQQQQNGQRHQQHTRGQQQQQQQHDLQPRQQRTDKMIGSPRPFGSEKPTRVQEFKRTGVLHPEYQIPATLRPGNISQFYYLSPREGPPLTLLVSPCSGPISWTVSYVEPPENVQDTSDGPKSQTKWPVKTLKPGSPLFTYRGAEDKNFTIPKTRAGLYWFEIKSIEPTADVPDGQASKKPKTVLLYATSGGLEHLPSLQASDNGERHRSLRFQQRRSRRRLTVSWNKSQVDPHLSNYCLAVTSGSEPHPATLCAAQNVLRVHLTGVKGNAGSSASASPASFSSSFSSSSSSSSSKEHQHRGTPEGLHCVRQTKLTLHRMQYDTVYNFTLYVVNMRNNVSNRVATDAIKFRRTAELTLRAGRYVTTSLRKTDGSVNFRYRPPDNTSSVFHILPCGGGIVKAKLSGPGLSREKEVIGYGSLKVPALPLGKTYTLRVSATPQELIRLSAVKVLATQGSSPVAYPQVTSKSTPREYKSLRSCNEVTVGVEPAGTAKYCILVRELRGGSSLVSVATMPDQCGLHRRRRSEYTFEVCEKRKNPPPERALPFTLKKLQPGKSYVLQITAQLKDRSLSYPLLGVRTRRVCRS